MWAGQTKFPGPVWRASPTLDGLQSWIKHIFGNCKNNITSQLIPSSIHLINLLCTEMMKSEFEKPWSEWNEMNEIYGHGMKFMK